MPTWEVTAIKYRQGTSFARGTDIDPYLTEDEVEKLYARWSPEWPEPLLFSGGAKSITCEMVLEVPEKELRKVYYKNMTAKLLKVAEENAGR